MNRFRWMGGSFLLLAASSLLMVTGCGQKKVREIDVPLAATDLKSGNRINERDYVSERMTVDQFRESNWPMNEVMLSTKEINNRIPRKDIKKGQPFLTSELYPVNEPHLILNLSLQTAPQNIDAVRGALARLSTMARQERGCLRFDVYQSTNAKLPGYFFILQYWNQPDDYKAFTETELFKEVFGKIIQPIAKVTWFDAMDPISYDSPSQAGGQ